jgi:hypothetical protein
MPGNLTCIGDVGKQLLLADHISGALNGALCRLFVNTPTIDHTTDTSDYTEPPWSGYAQQSLAGWSAPALDGSFHAFTSADPVNFANSSGSSQIANGYFYTDVSGTYIGGAYFPSPITIPDGLYVQVTVTHTETAEFPTSP